MGIWNDINEMPEAARAALLAELAEISERDLEAMFIDWLDDCHAPVKIAGYEYATSAALAAVDPTAYRCTYADWVASSDDAFTEISGSYYATDALEAAYQDWLDRTET